MCTVRYATYGQHGRRRCSLIRRLAVKLPRATEKRQAHVRSLAGGLGAACQESAFLMLGLAPDFVEELQVIHRGGIRYKVLAGVAATGTPEFRASGV
jgi:hypothetical protein